MKKKILIVQNYNVNKGDASVIYAMKNSLLQKYSDVEIALTSYDPNKACHDYKLNSSEWLIDYKRINDSNGIGRLWAFIEEFIWLLLSLLWLLLNNINFSSLKIIPERKKSTVKKYIDAEIVVLPGGHFFSTLNKLPVVFSHYYSLWFASVMNKKIMVYAQTFGPFSGKAAIPCKLLAKSVIKFSQAITVREPDSLKYDINNKMVLTAESVFLNGRCFNIKRNIVKRYISSEREIVGITIHHIYYKQFFKRSTYVGLMSKIVNSIISRGYCVLFIPMESIRGNNTGDRVIIESIMANINDQKSVSVVKDDLGPSETELIITSVDFFIGTKTHSIVYGLKNFVPTISIAYQEKSNQFMKMFGVLENSINLVDLEVHLFMKIFDHLIQKKQYYSDIERKNYSFVLAMAKKNNEILYKLLIS